MHAINDCDTTSCPFGKGKTTALKMLLAEEFNGLADVLGEVDATLEALMEAATAYFTAFYGQLPGTSLESARFKLFTNKKKSLKIMALPPTCSSMFFRPIFRMDSCRELAPPDELANEDCSAGGVDQDKSEDMDQDDNGINDVGHLELSGVTDDGRRVMSVVQNNEDVSQTYLDNYLTWDIPDSWSLEEAATVPLAYATAYHCLIQTALLKSEETVLIHAGHTPVGQAAIAFALHIGSVVFTTVTEIIHKEFLMKRFPQNDDTYLHNLDVASRSLDSLSHFVSLIDKSGEDISESRIKADLPILSVQWSHGIKVSNYEGLEKLLPSNLQELEGVGFDFLSKTKSPLLLVPSLSSGIGYVPEVLPIFIVPGIKDRIKTFIEPLVKNILYPTICIDLQDHIVSLQDSATNIVKCPKLTEPHSTVYIPSWLSPNVLFRLKARGNEARQHRVFAKAAGKSEVRCFSARWLQHMKKIQPTGPYNLVGISWGGILAIEIARELSSQEQIFQLFLLDGVPETILNIIKQLGKADQLQFNLISRLLNMETNKVHEELIQLPNWKARVDYALNETPNISPRSKQYLASGLEASYIRTNKLLSYKPSETLLSGDVHLIQREGASQEDTCQLNKNTLYHLFVYKKSPSINRCLWLVDSSITNYTRKFGYEIMGTHTACWWRIQRPLKWWNIILDHFLGSAAKQYMSRNTRLGLRLPWRNINIFQGTVIVHTVESDQTTLLSNKATADIINDEALANIHI
uniref:oleoyl-[acyl-carrier-protein] hydrolase n=1 Tax=Timema genevievae TaxID=629358 RepID=A0A7R9PJ00_TIMGE|nr:unnamed protein product [Timema genevievae]